MERLATNVALQGNAPATPATLEEIATRRAAAGRDIARGMEILSLQAFPGRDALLGKRRDSRERLGERRRRADADGEALRSAVDSLASRLRAVG